MKLFVFFILLFATLMLFQLNSDFSSYSADRSHKHAIVLSEDAYIGYSCGRAVVKSGDVAGILRIYNNMDEVIWVKVEPIDLEGIDIDAEFEMAPHSMEEIFAKVSLPSGAYNVSFLIYANFENGSARIFTICSSEITVESTEKIKKTLISGNTTVPTKSRERWTFVISVENPEKNSTVKDTIPREFEIVSYSASTGTVKISPTGRAKHIFWTLSETGSLTVTVETTLNPAGKQEFTSAGEYCLNDGAELDGVKTQPIMIYARD